MNLTKKERLSKILSYVAEKEITAYEISKNTKISEAGIGKILNGKSTNPRETTVDVIYNYLFSNVNTKQNAVQIDTLTEKIYKGKTVVTVVTMNTQASWSDAYYSQEFLKDMPTVLIESDEDYKGNYLAFEVNGESMETEYYTGDIVICREIQRHLWQSKLHYKDYDYVIAHATKGIMLKEITEHNVETGEITCHSLHPSHDDFILNLKEVAYLYNVVEVRQKGTNKKRNR